MSDEPILPEGPGFGLTFLYYFSGVALATTFLAVKALGVSLDTGIPNQFGLLFGVIGGLLGATFNRSKTLDLPFTSKKTFRQKLETTLSAMGYSEDPNANLDGILVYRRSPLRQLFSGKIYVLLTDQQAHISSRVSHLRGLQRQLQKL
jgi:hypothetical protein